ncbi:uncharacterized protein M421DRAFT_396349 [Didymella exigua CBS 183.55]|uniref:Uncharacterized protein n=1 Tax=Didymella exigua CBS 183.55 TaxID=1150837 RepID=A0A6A5RHC6_9PLEO|nr:uncharacterized protein M421DRAFT_396349 [Didymella exigua CBS 183.55]KAF1926528.1 hypothetical protein M421DRAFT_396349 [Didymella exigua CBS 183.55]
MAKPSPKTQPQESIPETGSFVDISRTPGPADEPSVLYKLNNAVDERSTAPSNESQSGQLKDVIRAVNEMKLNDEEEEKRGLEGDQVSSKGIWEDSVLAWLDLICLHISGITTLAQKGKPNTFDRRVGQIIRNVKIDLVKATMRRCQNDHSPQQINMITEWTLNEGQIEGMGRGLPRKYFDYSKEMVNHSGTYHCEATTMALYLLEESGDEIVDLDAKVNLTDPDSLHLRLPPRAVTAQFKDTLDILQVSKSSCPACYALVDKTSPPGSLQEDLLVDASLFHALQIEEDIIDTIENSHTPKPRSVESRGRQRDKAANKARRAERLAGKSESEPPEASSAAEPREIVIGRRERESLTPSTPFKPLQKKAKTEGEAGGDDGDAPMESTPAPVEAAEQEWSESRCHFSQGHWTACRYIDCLKRSHRARKLT